MTYTRILVAWLPLAVTAFVPVPSRTLLPTTIHPTTFSKSVESSRRLRILSASGDDDVVDDTKNWIEDKEDAAQKNVRSVLKNTDKNVMKRIVRIGNHVPTLVSLSYFGLISMAVGSTRGSGMGRSALSRVLTMPLGSTTNAMFSSYFPTLVTPPSPIFLVWPLIAVTQFGTVVYSALCPDENALLSQSDLTALSLANLASAAWLFSSSNASPGTLPLASSLILPLVPLLSGYPLRTSRRNPKKVSIKNFNFSLYSSFTTLASILALAVELQHGARVPFITGKAELVASLFLAVFAFAVRLPGQGKVKRSVNAAVVTGILLKRLKQVTAAKNLLSPSLIGTGAVAFMALKRLNRTKEEERKDTWEEKWEELKDEFEDKVEEAKDILMGDDDD